MSDIAIRVEHLSKMYRLGVINNGTLWKDIQTWAALKAGRADPHSKIGEDKYTSDDDHFWALKDLNFEIKQGDRVGIIGKNGAGKSTLLKILSRITAPTEGTIKVKGKIASLLEVGTGFHGELTGRENIYLNGAILGMKKRQIDRKLDEIIDFSGIEHHIDTPVKRYSSGMYVRLAFAVAAHLDSEILIADEVLAVGDAEFQKKALGKMQDLSTGQGRTVLFVSHNIGAIQQLCLSGILLEQGTIRHLGNIESTISTYMKNDNEFCSQIKKDYLNEKGTEIIQISEVSLRTKDGEIVQGEISQNTELFYEIHFNYKRYENDLTIGFTLFNEMGDNIYRSLTSDLLTDFNDRFSIGSNKISCIIPIQFLKSGEYYINLDVSIHMQKWIVDPYSDKYCALSFSIINTNFGVKHITASVVAPQVEWRWNA